LRSLIADKPGLPTEAGLLRSCGEPLCANDGETLVLQLLLLAFSVMSSRCCGLMPPSPEGPTENKDEIKSRLEQDPGEQRVDFRDGRHEIRQ